MVWNDMNDTHTHCHSCWCNDMQGYVLPWHTLPCLLMHTFWMDTHGMDTYELAHWMDTYCCMFCIYIHCHSCWCIPFERMDTDWEDMCRMMLLDMTVVQKSCIQILNLGFHNRHIYMIFHFPLCGVTQGNPAKHKLGARFRQGWRKCFHALSWYILTYLQITSEGF